MIALAGPLLNTLLFLFISQCIRYYPLKNRWRVSLKTIVALYTVVFAVQCVIFIAWRDYFAADFLGNQVFRVLTGLLYVLIPFFLTRDSIFENMFLIAVVANYSIVIFGVGSHVELVYAGGFAKQYPYLICTGLVTLISLPLLPLLLRSLRRIFGMLPADRPLIWRFIWIIPTLFAGLCMMSANIFMGENAVTAVFVIARVFIGTGLVITCYLFARMIQQITETETAKREAEEHAAETEFYRRMSHELRTPLTKVSTNIQIANRQENTDHELLTKSQGEIMRIAEMINSALDDGAESGAGK